MATENSAVQGEMKLKQVQKNGLRDLEMVSLA